MFEIKLNENETISLDEKTILSCLFIYNSNVAINNNLGTDLSKIIQSIELDIIDTDNKEEIINDKFVRIIILCGLKEKIEKELCLLS